MYCKIDYKVSWEQKVMCHFRNEYLAASLLWDRVRHVEYIAVGMVVGVLAGRNVPMDRRSWKSLRKFKTQIHPHGVAVNNINCQRIAYHKSRTATGPWILDCERRSVGCIYACRAGRNPLPLSQSNSCSGDLQMPDNTSNGFVERKSNIAFLRTTHCCTLMSILANCLIGTWLTASNNWSKV